MYSPIQLWFSTRRNFFVGADAILNRARSGRAHRRLLHFAASRTGITLAELLDIFLLTKQSLSRVCNKKSSIKALPRL
jgi:hypothetical protein